MLVATGLLIADFDDSRWTVARSESPNLEKKNLSQTSQLKGGIYLFGQCSTGLKVVGQGGATLASPRPDTGRSPPAFKVQALARCTWVSSLPLPPDKPTPAHTHNRTLAIE